MVFGRDPSVAKEVVRVRSEFRRTQLQPRASAVGVETSLGQTLCFVDSFLTSSSYFTGEHTRTELQTV